jgi:hypothetical protein
MATQKWSAMTAGIIAALVVVAAAPAAWAQPDPAAVARARRIADKRQVAKDVVEQVLQVGATFTRKSFRGVRVLEDGERQPTRYFALDYRYRWNSYGWTDVAYICNETGLVTGLQVLNWRAEDNEAPFANAKANAAVFGAALLKLAASDPKFTADDKAVVAELVDARDAHKLLSVYLMVAQRVEETSRLDKAVIAAMAGHDQ